MLPMSSPHQMIHNSSLILFIHTPSNPHTPCNDLITNYMLCVLPYPFLQST